MLPPDELDPIARRRNRRASPSRKGPPMSSVDLSPIARCLQIAHKRGAQIENDGEAATLADVYALLLADIRKNRAARLATQREADAQADGEREHVGDDDGVQADAPKPDEAREAVAHG